MIKEELEKEAEEYANKRAPKALMPNMWRRYFDSYLAGAEPREKRIAELEEENAILKGRTEGFEKQILGLLYKYESVYKRFPDLKDAMSEAEKVLKENAELKQQIEQMQDANCTSCTELGGMQLKITDIEKENTELKAKNKWYSEQVCNKECAEVWGNLTKAKEIIKGLLPCCRNYPQENAKKMEQAEQFLQETDIDNAIQQANKNLDLDKIADEVEEDLKEGCPDILCEDCTKEDCTVRELGLVPAKEIEK